MDNLVMTNDSPKELCNLYALSRERLQLGGFELKSCSSKCVRMWDKMKTDGTLSSHGVDWEKVLGNHYNPLIDTQCIVPISCDHNASIK